MPFLKRREQEGQNAATLEKSVDPNLPANPELPAQQKVTFIAVFMGLVASIGGFMFGYASGQISGKEKTRPQRHLACSLLTL